MPPKISVQLYSLREQTKDGKHLPVLQALAKAGFAGVELAGLYGMAPKELRRVVEDLGLLISSNHHFPCPTPENVQQAIDLHRELGLDHLITGFWENEFKTVDAIRRTGDQLNAVAAPLARAGITIALHNHWFEFQRVRSRIAYEWLAEACPSVAFEIDTYWAANFGAEDPAQMVRLFRERTPFLHLKDGPLTKDEPMVAAGSGKQDFAAILAAADPRVVRWGVVELDRCATDMLEAVIASHRYLTGKGFVVGR